jgi:hypothetical protein
MIDDGARPNLFEVTLNVPPNVGGTSDIGSLSRFMIKASQLPGSTIGSVPVYYFGREVKFAGNRSFANWSVQVINDENFAIRNYLERWMNTLNSHVGNLRQPSALSPVSYTTDAFIRQYGKTGDILKVYKFAGMFPIDIAPIDLDWGNQDSIEEFGVTFAYQWWEAADSTDVS